MALISAAGGCLKLAASASEQPTKRPGSGPRRQPMSGHHSSDGHCHCADLPPPTDVPGGEPRQTPGTVGSSGWWVVALLGAV